MDPNTPPKSPISNAVKPDKDINVLQDINIPYLKTTNQFTNTTQNVVEFGQLESTKPDDTSDQTITGQPLAIARSILHENTIARITRLLQSANGLDKVIRTIQYVSRLLSHAMLVKDLHTSRTSAAAKGIRRQFGLTRRLLRAFNNVSQLHVTIKLLQESPQRIKNDTPSCLCDLIEALGFLGFGITDTLGYLPDAGILNIPYRNIVDKLAFHFWLYALFASILGGLLKIHRLRNRISSYRLIFPAANIEYRQPEAKLSPQVQSLQRLPPTPPGSPTPVTQTSVDEAALSVVNDLQTQNQNMSLNILGSLADIIFPLAALKVSPFNTLSDGVLGFAGCVSSAVGMRKAWSATA